MEYKIALQLFNYCDDIEIYLIDIFTSVKKESRKEFMAHNRNENRNNNILHEVLSDDFK